MAAKVSRPRVVSSITAARRSPSSMVRATSASATSPSTSTVTLPLEVTSASARSRIRRPAIGAVQRPPGLESGEGHAEFPA